MTCSADMNQDLWSISPLDLQNKHAQMFHVAKRDGLDGLVNALKNS